MCRKPLSILLVFCLLIALFSGCAKGDSTAETMTQAVQSATIVITGSQTESASSKNPVLVVHYEFTNNTAAPVSFAYLCKDTVYQDGIACEVAADALGTTPTLLYRDVKPGVTQKLSIGYKLKNKTSVVEIEIKEWLGDGVLLRQILTP